MKKRRDRVDDFSVFVRPPRGIAVCNAVGRYVINASCRCYRCRGRYAKVVRVTTGDVRSCCRNGILLSVSPPPLLPLAPSLSLSLSRSHRSWSYEMPMLVDRCDR